ncbi:cell division protein FtsL [Sporosarcina ureilytica]|uniref:Cell division protein FtsL n=1 Tax=Sporosarcina ureilytica TaxID=298596 RepID=A0A1D8JI13_9BACL|nr:cell division protein FtsL [Sporosarcina ureilytica]AOV08349.1 cell division protein FtsL [Sporosarcina ureilytica]
MALEQRKFVSTHVHEQEMPVTPERQQGEKRARKLFSPGEKVLFVAFASLLVIFSSVILHTEGQLNDLNREVQTIGTQIEQQSKQNTQLSIQVKEQSTHERVWEKARELGLNLNEKNVKVVPGR